MKIIQLECAYVSELLIDITYHDSGEEPEDECVNKVVSFKAGDRLYQYFGVETEEAFDSFQRQIQLDVKHQAFVPPKYICAVITNFKTKYVIDWTTIERSLTRKQQVAS